MWWDAPDYAIPIGFMFHFFNDSTTNLYLTPEGGSDAVVNIHPLLFSTPYNSCIIAHGSNFIDKDTSGVTSASPISYSLSGIAPSRIFKLEWKNAGFAFGVDADSINLQLWIYETSDIIEMRFGVGNYVSSITDLYNDAPGPWVGLADSIDRNASNISARMFYQLKGPVSSPTLDSSTVLDPLLPVGMTGNPTSGSVYRFYPKVKTTGGVGYNTYSTIVSSEINYFSDRSELRIDIFSDDKFNFQVLDMNGNILFCDAIQKGRKIINTNNLASGIFILKLFSAKENIAFKFVR